MWYVWDRCEADDAADWFAAPLNVNPAWSPGQVLNSGERKRWQAEEDGELEEARI